jgi:protoheme IX farnesyltransferase
MQIQPRTLMASTLLQKLNDYKQLMKLNLSMLVVFSSVVGYVIVPDLRVEVLNVVLLFLGGLLVTAAANASNEVLERRTDALMRRTKTRPLPDARMSTAEAMSFAMATLLAGLWVLSYFNLKSVLLALFCYLLYAFVYTPLKRISPVSVLIGAVPGSLPCLIGWVAATDHMGSVAAWTLFIIQFFWQFPHFWAIAWLAHEDYEKAGMKMLPQSGKVGAYTASQCVLYSAVLLPMSALPMVAGIGGWISLTGLFLAACWLLYKSVLFLRETSDDNARQVMFASFVYLPVVLVSLVVDKFV